MGWERGEVETKKVTTTMIEVIRLTVVATLFVFTLVIMGWRKERGQGKTKKIEATMIDTLPQCSFVSFIFVLLCTYIHCMLGVADSQS